MASTPTPEDIHTRIQNTIAMLQAEVKSAGGAAQHGFHLAVDTLKACRGAIEELEAQLDLVTAPDLDAAQEARRLRQEVEKAELRVAFLEQELASLREQHSFEEHVHEEEVRRLHTLEKQAKDFEDILEKDEESFGRFMDRALDDDEKKGRLKR